MAIALYNLSVQVDAFLLSGLLDSAVFQGYRNPWNVCVLPYSNGTKEYGKVLFLAGGG